MAAAFDYHEAFSRNIGWLTEWEQERLREKRVAIAGMGGVGGAHLLTLARLGIGAFTIADFDTFELANFNRQAGASLSSIGRPKAEVMAEAARDINPELDIRVMSEGVTLDTIDAFLDGVDMLVDGLDFFVVDIRRAVFARAYEKGIPAVTAAPLGIGTAYLLFLPGGMSFEDYFRLEGEPAETQYVKFALGLAPAGLHRGYLVDSRYLNLAAKRGPSTIMACQLCAGVAATEVMKVLLGRKGAKPAPWYHQFDPLLGRFVSRRLVGGNRNLLQRIMISFGVRYSRRLAQESAGVAAEADPQDPLMRILSTARWAPSGDNEQPWRFEVTGERSLRVHLTFHSDNPYEFAEGRPVLLAAGMLVETMALAAAREGWILDWRFSEDNPDILDVEFQDGGEVKPDPLAAFITVRSVDRRPFRAVPLDDDAKRRLEGALRDDALEVVWRDGKAERRQVTALNSRATRLRLTIPECRKVHHAVIDHQHDFSPTGIPAVAVGLDPLTTKSMQWVNAAWWRTALVNRWLGGAIAASLQLDFRQGRRGGGHFLIRWKTEGQDRPGAEWVRAGRAAQRFWLQAAREGLALQPSFAPLIFAYYAKHERTFSTEKGAQAKARAILNDYSRIWGDADDAVFPGRVGLPASPRMRGRSVRLPLASLIKK